MEFFLQSLATVISVVDPIGVAPIFLGLTPGMVPAMQRRVMRNAVLVAFVILMGFAVGGRVLLHELGITLIAFNISGGILLLLISIDMLFARTPRTRETPEEDSAARLSTDVSVFPLAIPILSGPGSIATVILYVSLAGSEPKRIAAVVLSVILALAASYLAMRVSGVLVRVLGETGINVVGRVIGVLLAALAVQFMLNGVSTYIQSVRR